MPSRIFTQEGPVGTYYRDDLGTKQTISSKWGDHSFTLEEGVHSGSWPRTLGMTDTGGGFGVTSFTYRAPLVGPFRIKPPVGAYATHKLESMFHSSWNSLASWDIPTDRSPDGFGAEAYSKMRPDKPEFQALNFLYELRELPGMLKQRFLDSGLSSVGDYWLALQFGWKPLLSDVRKLVNVQKNAQKRLQQLLRDNGRPVRRKVTLRSQPNIPHYDYHQTGFNFITPSGVTQFHRREESRFVTMYYTDHVWASAQFRYWLPGGPRDVAWKAKMMRELYGLTPSPSAIYNMVPWSWLVDWFSTVGDAIANLDMGVTERLAADWFYVMRQRSFVRRQDAIAYFWDWNGAPVDISATSVAIAESKMRSKGDPFGFRTKDVDLSAMQMSILGALGLSRLR